MANVEGGISGAASGATVGGSSGGAWGAGIGGVLGGIGGLFSDGASGENVEKKEPAPRSPGAEVMWDDFMSSIYGYDPVPDLSGYLRDNPDIRKEAEAYQKETIYNIYKDDIPTSKRNDGKENITKYLMKHWMNADERQGYFDDYAMREYRKENPAEGVSLLDRITEDVGAQRGLAETRISESDALGQELIKSLTQETNRARNEQDQLINALAPVAKSSPINLKFGDNFSMPFTTGTQGSAQRNFTDLTNQRYNRGTDLAGNIFNTGQDQSTLSNALRTAMPPNLAERQYYDELRNINLALEPLRYGAGTMTSTGSYDAPSSPFRTANDILNLFSNNPFAKNDIVTTGTEQDTGGLPGPLR